MNRLMKYRKRRRECALVLLFCMLCTCLYGCSGKEKTEEGKTAPKVTLTVSTMYAGDDLYTRLFSEAASEWEELTGNTIASSSNTADEAYKNRIIMEFQTGAEPDVLFYFNGVDSNTLVSNKRVVSIDEIRKVYPSYASNMKESMMKASPYDGKIYCIPVNGYWEALFVNKKACSEADIPVPDENTDWDAFMDICEKAKKSGYTPIAAALGEVPHYWFEYCIYNYQTPDNHMIVPEFVIDNMGQAWVSGLTELKAMYDRGFFPENTLYMSDEAAKKLFLDGEALFLLEGSWYAASIDDRKNSEDYCVTYVPGTLSRKTTDIISGLSTGYYITRKAWEDPKKREAAVSFVEYMTKDEQVLKFAQVSATALANPKENEDTQESSEFIASAKAMAAGATGYSEAVQDFVPTACRAPVFEHMRELMKGETEISQAVHDVLSLKKGR